MIRMPAVFLLAVLAASSALAGPNAGGTLVAHDADLFFSATNGSVSLCSQGSIPASCLSADARVDGALSAAEAKLFRVYAAFLPGSAPRLMGITWGVQYPADLVVLGGQSAKCGDFELNDEGWPASGTGSTVTWNTVQTSALVPVYAFCAYQYEAGSPAILQLTANPSQGGYFGDDSVPAVLDEITGYGSIGFGTDGNLVCPAPVGACCNPATGGCTLTTQGDCVPPSVFHNDWTSCDPNPCPQPIGACCNPATGACTLTTQAGCAAPNVWHAEWTSCDPNPCPQPSGACCFPDGSCTFTPEAECSGAWQGFGTICTPNPCPPPSGACCYPDGHCAFLPQSACPTGDWRMLVPCEPNPCPPPPPPSGACCALNGGCILTVEADCHAPSVWHGEWTLCSPNPCPIPSGGPNAGGTLVVHDAALLVSGTNSTVCGEGSVPVHCGETDAEIDGSTSADPAIFKVYAAFYPSSAPRLMGVTWGVDYPAQIRIAGYGLCGDFELNDEGWPASGTGSSVTWDQVQTAELTAVYWFAAYNDGAPGLFKLAANPDQGGWFGDDAVPAHLDPIDAYGQMGFDTPGTVACPEPVPIGACCREDGACSLTTPGACPPPSVWHSEWSACEPNPCPQPLAACCAPDGSCAVTTEDGCAPPGVWHPEWESCVPNPCPPPSGACCAPVGTCTITIEADCPAPDVWHPEWTSCTPNPCPLPLGSCCYADGHCVYTTLPECSSGVWHMEEPCEPNPCPQPGACCRLDGSCIFLLQTQCTTEDWREGVPCDPNPCPVVTTGACCQNLVCTVTTQPECAGVWMGLGTDCSPNPCCAPPRSPGLAGGGTAPSKAGGFPHASGREPASVVGPGTGRVSDPPGDDDPCPDTIVLSNDDGSFENGYTWSYGGVAPPFYGAWAEGFTAPPGQGVICGADLYLSQVGGQNGWLMDLYLWDSAGGNPNLVLCLATGINPGPIGFWPEVTRHQVAFNSPCTPSGDFFIGYWPYWVNQGNGWWVAGDENGFGGGRPRTNIVPCIGYPTGWNHPNVVSSFAGCQDLGIHALLIPDPGAERACCAPDGSCTLTSQAGCAPPAVWHYGWTSCDPNPCPQSGACCDPNGACTFVQQSECQFPSSWHGEWTTCAPNPCPQPGACCGPDGGCEIRLESQCVGSWMGPGTACEPNPCPQPAACCSPQDGSCLLVVPAECNPPSIWHPEWTSCDPNPCPQPLGACCHPDGSCTVTVPGDCSWPGHWQGAETDCSPNPCPQPGACCAPDGACSIVVPDECQGLWLGGVECSPNPCPPAGACCAPGGGCTIRMAQFCYGEWMGPGTDCVPNPCSQPETGACCVGLSCTITTPSGCAGVWMGPGTTCTPNPCCAHPPAGPLVTSRNGEARAVGQGHGTVINPPSPDTICPGSTFQRNDDGSYENGYAWAYGGEVAPYYGAWAEGFTMSPGEYSVCGVMFGLTQVGAQDGWLMDIYLWDSAGGNPNNVLCVVTGVNPGTIGMWPCITAHPIQINCWVAAQDYFVGWWGQWAGQQNGWYIAADENGFGGGQPRTNIAPGIGFPTGWQHPNVVSSFAGCQDLGIGTYETGGATPVQQSTWGRIKAMYRDAAR